MVSRAFALGHAPNSGLCMVIFLIRHEKTGAILFMGRVADPTK